MALSGHTKNALRVSLGISASNEVIPLLDLLSDKVAEEKRRSEIADIRSAVTKPAATAEPNPGPTPNEAGVPVDPPPVSNDHVAEGATPFTPEEVALNAAKPEAPAAPIPPNDPES